MGNPFAPKSSLKVALKCNLKSAKIKCPRIYENFDFGRVCSDQINLGQFQKGDRFWTALVIGNGPTSRIVKKISCENFVFFQDVYLAFWPLL